MNLSLEQAVQQQRDMLSDLLSVALFRLAQKLPPLLADRLAIEAQLRESCTALRYCKYLYVMDRDGVQLTGNIHEGGVDESQLGRDRSARPYMQSMFGDVDFRLSEAYISRYKKRPSLTAIQVIRDGGGERIGFLGVDYDLRNLPRTEALYQEPREWRQIKGDPAIRGGLFAQQRTQSRMDDRIDDVLALLEELMLEHGVFHGKLHFSSSRATVWHAEDPYSYRILTIDELTDPDICLAYPRRPYFERAIVPSLDIMNVFEQFRRLRFGDETIYLRSGSLNLVNGMVGLNFSCDGSHYLRYDEFLDKGLEFWFGVE